jgi:hypothetical protein
MRAATPSATLAPRYHSRKVHMAARVLPTSVFVGAQPVLAQVPPRPRVLQEDRPAVACQPGGKGNARLPASDDGHVEVHGDLIVVPCVALI